MNASTTTPTKEAPLLPPEPWYTSHLQWSLVLAAASQIVSVLLRIIGRYTDVSITTDDVDALFADLTQLAAVVLGIVAIVKRKNSEIQPLTLTAGGAASKAHTAQLNPVTMEKRQAGRAQALFIALLLGLAIVSVGMSACQTIGVPTPQTFSERLATGYSSVTAVRTSAATLLNGRVISSSDAENVQKQADTAREALDIARGLTGVDAQNKLDSALLILQAAQAYLCKKNPTDPNCAALAAGV
jgi:hypothetical protein